MKGEDLLHNGEIVLEGVIATTGDEHWYESGVITAGMVRDALAAFDGDVVIKVNSPGGNPVEAEAIRVLLQSHPGRVTAQVVGDASSAASLMVMGADRVEMSEGSIMMIHDPSSITYGTADDHLKGAEMLDVMASTYAAVYAKRSGKTVAAVRQLMKDETWMGPARAVAEGFADAIMGGAGAPEMVTPDMISGGRARHAAALTMLARAPASKEIGAGQSAPEATAAGGHARAEQAIHKESNMTKPNPIPAGQPTAGTAAADLPAVDITMTARDEATRAERQRILDIEAAAAPFMASGLLMQADVDAKKSDGSTVADASQFFLATMARAQAPAMRSTAGTGGAATIRRDETDTRLEGMIGALMGHHDGPAAGFRGLRLKSLAMHLAGPQRGFQDGDAIRRGMVATSMMGGAHGVSDFSYITTEVMNRTLLAEYARRAPNWQQIAGRPLSAADFREMAAVRFGGDLQLKKVMANGEYTEATLADEREGLKVERRGRTINITFEAVINDDMGAFNRLPGEFAREARAMEASMVWSLIRSNAVLKSDNKALFHADHGNLAASGAVISTTTVSAARKAMWEQKALGEKAADGFIEVEANLLIVPPALELPARQFVAATTPATDATVNPYKATLTPVVAAHLGAAAGGSDTAWYLVSSDLPPVAHAYLEGFEAPTVVTEDAMNPDKMTLTARHIFGAAAVEFRGAWKNPGA